MRVSVICTVKDAEGLIDRAVASVRAQTVADWEMVVVDDGSVDDSRTEVAAQARSDSRIRLIASGGIGRGPALNRAVRESQADLIANIDADDLWHPQRLERQLDALHQDPGLAVLTTRYLRIDIGEEPVWPPLGRHSVRDVTRELARRNPICHSAVLMRRETVRAVGGYREDLRSNFDYDLWVRCARAGYRLGLLELPLVAKRIHAGQTFLHSPRFDYATTTIMIQARAMHALGLTHRYWPLLPARLVWSALPLRWRVGPAARRRPQP